MGRTSRKKPAEPPAARRSSRIRAFIAASAAVLAAVAAQQVAAADGTYKAGPAPGAARRAELITMVRQDCGSCHGLTLKGGLGPALVPDALRDKPADSLKAVILHGRPGTPMPPWQRFLSEEEADWIVANLLKGFPDER